MLLCFPPVHEAFLSATRVLQENSAFRPPPNSFALQKHCNRKSLCLPDRGMKIAIFAGGQKLRKNRGIDSQIANFRKGSRKFQIATLLAFQKKVTAIIWCAISIAASLRFRNRSGTLSRIRTAKHFFRTLTSRPSRHW